MTRPLVMGIVNVTPDSFSDGGRFLHAEAAIAHGLRLIEEGADWLDIGGESTRPGAAPVSFAEEIDRVLPVIEGLRDAGRPLSIDTMKPEVAAAAARAGARMWNNVAGFRDSASLEAAAALGVAAGVMHMQGEPRSMQANPVYGDVVEDVGAFLEGRARALAAVGVTDVWVDPGIGFGKTLDHNLALIRAIEALKARTGRPLLFGASRKSLIGKIDARASQAHDRLGGSLALALYAAKAGAGMLRVHDVKETAQALAVAEAIG